MRFPWSWGFACAALGLSFFGEPALSARAQALNCGETTDPVEELHVQPGDAAEAVALDAPIAVRYSPEVDLDALQRSLPGANDDPCQSQLVCLFYDARKAGGGAREPVFGRVSRIDSHTAVFVPGAALRAHTHYFPLIARAGFDTASRTELEFTTGAHTDHDPPSFNPNKGSIRLSVAVPPVECHAATGSLRVALAIPRATDDGDEQSVEISLFLTRAAGLRGPVLRARARNPPADQARLQLSFLLDKKAAREPVCMALRAADGVGRLSRDEPELCFDPLRGSFFAPCSIAEAPGAARGLAGDGLGRSLITLCAVAAIALVTRGRQKTRSV